MNVQRSEIVKFNLFALVAKLCATATAIEKFITSKENKVGAKHSSSIKIRYLCFKSAAWK